MAKYRAYEADLGRWISRDPIGYDDGPNIYGYVHNNPLRYYDPFGLEAHQEAGGPVIYVVVLIAIRVVVACGRIVIRFILKLVPKAKPKPPKNPKKPKPPKEEVTKRKEPGRDGGESKITKEIDDDGKTISKKHTVTKDGKVIHQHKEHFGKSGSERRFPDKWTGSETINAPAHTPKRPKFSPGSN